MSVCHDCGAEKGEYHDHGCDTPICIQCGGQLMQCGHFKNGNTRFTGTMYSELKLLCADNGLYCRTLLDGIVAEPEEYYPLIATDQAGRISWYVPCKKDDCGAGPDINKAMMAYECLTVDERKELIERDYELMMKSKGFGMKVIDFVSIFQPSVAKIVDVLLANPNESFTFRQLLGKAQVGTATLHRGLAVLQEYDVAMKGEPVKTRGPLAQTWKLVPSSTDPANYNLVALLKNMRHMPWG